MADTNSWDYQIATLSHSSEGTSIWIEEVPLWALIAEWAGEKLMDLTGHIACCGSSERLTEFLDKIQWGPADEDGWSEYSLGYQLHRFGSWACLGFGAWRKHKEVVRIPVTYEWVREHYPDAGWPFNGGSEDEMNQRPADPGDMML